MGEQRSFPPCQLVHTCSPHLHTSALQDGWTPVHIAAQYGHLELVRLLLQKGANLDAASNVGAVQLMRWKLPLSCREISRSVNQNECCEKCCSIRQRGELWQRMFWKTPTYQSDNHHHCTAGWVDPCSYCSPEWAPGDCGPAAAKGCQQGRSQQCGSYCTRIQNMACI